MENQVHIIPQKAEAGQKYDPKLNSLVLKKAGPFNIAIKEIEDLKKQKPIAPRPVTEISDKDYKELSKKGRWNYDVDVNQYDIDLKKYTENLKLYNESLKKFDDLNWTWQLVYNGLDPNKITHYAAFEKGIHERISFPELIEGGAIAWLEAWHENEKPKGISPFGMYVQAEGVAQIVRAEWTDLRYNTINKDTTVAFGSKVILHIYTAGLYGQEVEVHLADRDIFTPNDKLKIAGEDFFTREVKVHKLKPNDINKKGVTGILTVDNAQVDYAQKIEIEVILDNAWIKTAGANLQIYAVVKSIKTGTFFKEFSRSYIHVSDEKKSITLDQEPIPATNMPLIVGDVETNVGAFEHCRYTAIELKYEKEAKTETVEIFKENPGVSYNSNIEIGLILGSVPKKFSIKVDDSNTDECRFHEKPKDHAKNIFTFDKLKSPKNVSITKHEPTNIEGTAYFDYDEHNIFNYIWPTKSISGNFPVLNINIETCRHQHDMSFKIYPDVVWALAFTFSLKNPLAYTYSAGKDNKNRFDEDNKDSAKGELIYAEAHKKAYNSGNDRNKLRQGKAIDGELTISLKGKYNKIEDSVPTRYRNEFEYGPKIEQKLNYFLDKLLYIKKIAQNAKEATGGAARKSDLIGDQPFSFEIQSPKIGAVIEWKAEEVKEGEYKGQICNTGVIKIVADPLLGAEFTINMLAVAAKMNPVVLAIKKGVDIGLNGLGGYMKLDAVFHGSINITIETLKLNSLEGFKLTDKPPKIDGKMGIKVVFQLKIEGKMSIPVLDYKLDFKADAKATGDAYFGGTALIKADDQGIYADLVIKFSGLIFSIEGEINIGRFKAKPFKVNPTTIWDSEQIPLGKIYLI